MSDRWIIDEERQQIRKRAEAATPAVPAPIEPAMTRGYRFLLVSYLAFIILAPCSCGVICEWYDYTHNQKNEQAIRKQGLVERGMTMEQVREILGPPDETLKRQSSHVQWIYDGYRENLDVHFDWEGHVVGVFTYSRGH